MALNQPLAPAGPSGPGTPTPQAGYQAPAGAVAQPHITPQQAYGTAASQYGPLADYLNAQRQGIATGQGINAQQLGNAQNYAQSQYGTGLQGLSLDQMNINAQRQGLQGDDKYIRQIYGNQIQGNAADRTYAQGDLRAANNLYNALTPENFLQRHLANNTLNYQLARLGYQSSQARGQATNDTQVLGQQVGAMGAYGSRGAGQRQGFINSSLANQLGEFNQDRGLATTQNKQTKSQLRQQEAGYTSTRENAAALDQRRITNAGLADKRAGYDFQHQGNQLNVNNRQLDIASARLGISRTQLKAALDNAMNNASLGYASGQLQGSQATAGNTYQNQQMFQNIGGLYDQILQAGH